MRRVVVKPLALFLVLTGVSLGLGQPQAPKEPAKPAKSKLEEMLAEALKNNPDIRVAVAKAAEAEAELNRTRLQVTQKVIALHHSMLSQKAAVEYAQKKYERIKKLSDQGSVDLRLVDEAQEAFAAAKAKLASVEAEIPAVLGKAALDFDADRGDIEFVRLGLNAAGKHWEVTDAKKATGPTADKVRKALETPIKVDFKEMPVADVLRDLSKQVPDLFINNATGGLGNPVTLRFEKALPVSLILQAVEDSSGIRFFVREYGILAASNGPTGALTVQEFMRQKPAEQSVHHNPPAESVEGLVKKVDSSGLVVISIGSDAGLTKGHTLELFRLSEQPSKSKYLGTIRILEAKPKEAVAQPVGRMTESPQVGDRVASRIVGK